MKINHLLLLLFFYLTNDMSLYGQQLEVKNISTDSFPKIKGQVWVRNTNNLESTSIKFSEKGNDLKVTYGNPETPVLEKKGRSILFLIENHGNFYNETKYYLTVIRSAINTQNLTAEDEIAVCTFDGYRPEYGSEKKQLLFPEKLNFVAGNLIENELSEIKENEPLTIPDNRVAAQIYTAIYTAISEFSKQNTKKPKSIFVFCNDFSRVAAQKEEAIINDAIKFNIPIYGFVFFKNLARNVSIKSICERSLGEYFLSSKSNDPTEMSDNLSVILKNYYEKQSGVNIPFTLMSTAEKNGESHLIDCQYRGEKIQFQYVAPKLTTKEWILKNIWISIGIVLCILLILFFVIFYVVKQKQKDKVKELQIEQTREELRKQSDKAEQERKKMESEMERIKQEQKEKEDAQARKIEEERKAAEEKKLIALMLKNGSFPVISYMWGQETGSAEINSPVFTIGRENTNNFYVNLGTVSKKHVEIKYSTDGNYYITDLGSTNGTMVNGKNITSVKLNSGDYIKLGEFGFTFTN